METVLVALIGAVSASVIAPIVTYTLNRRKRDDAQTEALCNGMRALLWRELSTIYRDAVEKGGMTVEERRHLEDVYDPYHQIGGNGTGTRLRDDALRLPVLD